MIVDTFDFYLHTSRYDAQATVILENCARGLVPLITPESGFSCPYAVYLTQDPARNREIIYQALAMPEDEYAERSRGVRAHVLEHHNWDRIYGGVLSAIQADQRAGGPRITSFAVGGAIAAAGKMRPGGHPGCRASTLGAPYR